MISRKVLAGVVLAVPALSLLAACSAGTPGSSTGLETTPAQRWVCRWDPTMNHDWHDDYLCTKGSQSDRPRLLPDDAFVERQEIDRAAADYEAKLNS
ncbi:MAG: hypothetical protein ABUT11_03715 [Leifsonia sp.]